MEGWVGLNTMSVNNLLKVITRKRSWWDSNPHCQYFLLFVTFRYHERMSLLPRDELIMSTTHLPYAVRQCIYAATIILYIYNYCQYFLLLVMFRYHERVSLLPRDELIMSTTHLPYALRQCIYAVNNATSHAAVSRALCRLRWYLVVTSPLPTALRHLNSLPWKPAVARYIMLYISVYYVIKS